MNELSLFTGAFGGGLGSILLGWRTICAVEKEPYCREVLLRRQRDGVLELFPIWDDIRTFSGKDWRGKVDIITAGFPCQPFSVAGQRRGQDDERNTWPDTIRVIREVGPRFAFLENVPGLLTHEYFGQILGDLAEAGFDAEWCVLGADGVGAPHRRKRLWILADSEHERCGMYGPSRNICKTRKGYALARGNMLDRATERDAIEGRLDFPKPLLFRNDDVVAHWVDRIRAIGNGQVPAVARAAWNLLRGKL